MKIDLRQITSTNYLDKAIEIYEYQYDSNIVYRSYIDNLYSQKPIIKDIVDIPFLPISFFKTHEVYCGDTLPDFYFESSSTTGVTPSRHYVSDLSDYDESIDISFDRDFRPNVDEIFALLPNYLERQHSSLVYMVNRWMATIQDTSEFYLYNHEDLYKNLMKSIAEGKRVLLIGVSFALLDFADKYQIDSFNLSIIETGGMKGTRKELVKQELVQTLKKSFPKSKIISEYGMCELLSQAYSDENLVFSTPEWMQVFVSELNDPLKVNKSGSGRANIVDLANVNSCSFIQTDDLITLNLNGTFTIIGRANNADIRGCSLLYS